MPGPWIPAVSKAVEMQLHLDEEVVDFEDLNRWGSVETAGYWGGLHIRFWRSDGILTPEPGRTGSDSTSGSDS